MINESFSSSATGRSRTHALVVVLGGAGFLGSHLCERLVLEGKQVVCIDNFSTGRRENVEELLSSGRFKIIDHDILEPFDRKIEREWRRSTISLVRHRRLGTRRIPSEQR